MVKFLITLFLVGPFLILFQGYVIAQMWNWLIVPVFPSAHFLSIVQALGLGLLVSYFTISTDNIQDKEVSDIVSSSLGKGIVFLGFAALYHWLM